MDLQEVMPHIANENGAFASTFEPEYDMSGRMARRRHNLHMIVEAVRSGDEIRAAGLDDRQHALAKGAELGRSFLGVGVERSVILEIRLGKDVTGVREGRHPAAVLELR